jgi:hypothetical protein
MHGIEHCILERRAPRFSAPRKPFSPISGLTLQSTPQPVSSPEQDRLHVTAFRSPATIPAFTGSIPGSKLPTCYFASLPAASTARSALLLPNPDRFAPVWADSTLLARCSFHRWLELLLFQSPLPFGTFTSLRIKAFNWSGRRSVRLPNPPDLLSLPAARIYR